MTLLAAAAGCADTLEILAGEALRVHAEGKAGKLAGAALPAHLIFRSRVDLDAAIGAEHAVGGLRQRRTAADRCQCNGGNHDFDAYASHSRSFRNRISRGATKPEWLPGSSI